MIDLSDPKQHAKFDLYASKFENGDWFTCELYRLISKADMSNRERIRMSFPLEVEIWEDWYYAPDEREHFAEFIQARQRQRED